jgi:hypothetical protein
MYRIDLDANAARLLDLDGIVPIAVKKELPPDYSLLFARYTDEIALEQQAKGDSNERLAKYLQVKSKYKDLLAELLESKLGINKSMQ